ncbi:DNA cytosine methyltransferase [Phocaeicola vulgatus]|jgi:DNA (cytosine-5)-methyltransferase 1|uniref:DNA cytosine methyltransferase n=1 Tax=Phocaeicola vulgatus TaxID=821 RepID=UPI000E71AA97|nr:DNA (cytosine-5-)-methyltransferase [Phocaeicola vulgatus]RJU53177.1 DNA (cytosine-5-)-methyltransferase [Bacteroides sp. AM27-13]
MKIKTFGSICSGIEAASFVFEPLGLRPLWFSEIADFPCSFLKYKYPSIINLGDMNDIPKLIANNEIEIPDFLCGGTPCQAFSLAGWKNGLNDDRGQLTLKYIDILNEIDKKRIEKGLNKAIFLWENVEGVLKDRTNAFGCFISGLAGLDNVISLKKWPSAGVLYGPDRNIAWRIIDSKYLGLPQQRKRLYVIGGGTDFNPENILLEQGEKISDPFKTAQLKEKELSLFDLETDNSVSEKISEVRRIINDSEIEVFRSYSDCLYAAYGTKWNGNAAAYNGSLFISQNGKIRRLTPLECERLMGFPDNYTYIPKNKDTLRYQAIGNSWAVPVIQWIGKRIINYNSLERIILSQSIRQDYSDYKLFCINDFIMNGNSSYLNGSPMISDYKIKNILDIIDTNAPEKFYISPKGCAGILRRKEERNLTINKRLEFILRSCSQI